MPDERNIQSFEGKSLLFALVDKNLRPFARSSSPNEPKWLTYHNTTLPHLQPRGEVARLLLRLGQAQMEHAHCLLSFIIGQNELACRAAALQIKMSRTNTPSYRPHREIRFSWHTWRTIIFWQEVSLLFKPNLQHQTKSVWRVETRRKIENILRSIVWCSLQW